MLIDSSSPECVQTKGLHSARGHAFAQGVSRISRRIAEDCICWLSSAGAAFAVWASAHIMLHYEFISVQQHDKLQQLSVLFAAIILVQQLTARSYAYGVACDWSQTRIALEVHLSMLVSASLTFPFDVFTGNLLLNITLLSFIAAAAARVIHSVAKSIFKLPAFKNRFTRRVAIYGATKSALKVREAVLRHGDPYEFVGLFEQRQSANRLENPDISISGSLSCLIEKVKDGDIDDVIISLPRYASNRTVKIANELRRYPVDVHVCTHFSADFPVEGLGWDGLSAIDGAGLLRIHRRAISDWGWIGKSFFDRLAAIALLVALSPAFILIAAAIKIDSTGPVFFRQRRHGLMNEIVPVWKFRTMNTVEDGALIRQAKRSDARVTKVGRWLRRTSLDELPQLFNVVLGQMALVGPRPHAVAHGDLYSDRLPAYPRRHQVLPGITGWAQINGHRGETDTDCKMQQRVEHDLWYIANWSFLLDLRILLVTPFLALTNKNAY